MRRAGERRLRACQQLEWSEIPCRLYKDLSLNERREIELEENIRRKDLTSAERSKNIVEITKLAAQIDKKQFRPKSGRNPKGGRPSEPGSLRRVAERTGIKVQTINDAQQHVAAIDRYPELAAQGIPQKDAITIAKNLDKLPEDERSEWRPRVRAMFPNFAQNCLIRDLPMPGSG